MLIHRARTQAEDFGDPLSGAQSYAILGTAPVQGHISGVVDIPNACATLWLPTEVFEFDIKPGADGPTKYLSGDADVPLAPDL